MRLNRLIRICKALKNEMEALNNQYNGDILSVRVDKNSTPVIQVHTPMDLDVVNTCEHKGYTHTYCELGGVQVMWCKQSRPICDDVDNGQEDEGGE